MSREKKSLSFWNMIKQACGVKPENVEGMNAMRSGYYFWELLELAKGRFEITAPDSWDRDFMLNGLLLGGFFGVTDTPVGVVPCICSPHGLNIYQRPNAFTISGAELVDKITGDLEREIGENGTLVYLRGYGNGGYYGIVEILNVYAEKLATCDASIDVSLINSRVPYVFECADGKQAEDAKKLYDKISRGEPAVFTRSNNATTMIGNNSEMAFHLINVKNSFIAADVQDAKRTIYNEFLTRFGLNNANTDKRERLNGDEVNANNEEIKATLEWWKENLARCSAEVRRLYPETNFNISIRQYKERSTVEREGEEENDAS